MARSTPGCLVVMTGFVLIGLSFIVSSAHAAEAARPLRLALLAEPGDMPAPAETAPPATAAPPRAGGGVPVEEPVGTLEEEGSVTPADLLYGAGMRLRWVSIPRWVLNLFTVENVPLSSWSTAVELFRRKGNFDFMLAVTYQNLSTGDGNWLGKSRDARVDTDYVQFRGLSFWGIDASFIWHTWFNKSFGMHYGAGLGIAKVFGDVLRTSNGSGCTPENAANVAECHPVNVNCASGTCSEADLQRLGPGVDTPATPHRFSDGNVPFAIPIVNVVAGIDFRVPPLPGLQLKIEGGFYDAFFLGGGASYAF